MPVTPPSGEAIPAPFDRFRATVRAEWIDHNDHMNMGFYLVVFDHATDEFLAWVGLDAGHRRAVDVTTFCLEAHVTYHREVRAGGSIIHLSGIEQSLLYVLASRSGRVAPEPTDRSRTIHPSASATSCQPRRRR